LLAIPDGENFICSNAELEKKLEMNRRVYQNTGKEIIMNRKVFMFFFSFSFPRLLPGM